MSGLWGAVAAVALFGAWWVVAARPAGLRWSGVAGSLHARCRPASVPGSNREPAASRGFGRQPSGIRVAGSLDGPLALELVAAMLDAGSPVSRALQVVARVSRSETGPLGRAAAALELGAPWDQAWPPEPVGGESSVRGAAEIRSALTFAAVTGAPSAELISARARLLRRKRHRDLERRAAALGVRLVVPLGACSLPAFLCLGVIPVLISMMPG